MIRFSNLKGICLFVGSL